MNKKYRILWLDDEFVNEDGTDNIPLPLIRMRYPDLEIVTVPYVDQCESILREGTSEFQAVIFDANGKYSNTPNQQPNKIGFEDLISLAKENHLPVYVFSGELSPKEIGDQADITKRNLKRAGFIEEVNLFYKAGTYKLLLDKIVDDLNNDFQIFYSYPFVLDNVLHYGVNKECCKKLLLWIHDKERNEFPPYIDLRRIIYDEAYDGKLKSFFGISKLTSIKKDQLTDKCMEPWEKAIILDLYKDLVNSNLHNWPSDNPYMQEVIANSFLIALNWFNRFMHQIEENPNVSDYYTGATTISPTKDSDVKKLTPNEREIVIEKLTPDEREGVIERDTNGFYHVGPYLLKSDWAYRHVGKKVRVLKDSFFYYKKLGYKTEFL